MITHTVASASECFRSGTHSVFLAGKGVALRVRRVHLATQKIRINQNGNTKCHFFCKGGLTVTWRWFSLLTWVFARRVYSFHEFANRWQQVYLSMSFVVKTMTHPFKSESQKPNNKRLPQSLEEATV
ncbi:hypothetical protein AAMO2058_001721700 [Amorphochlora amoebiformis]